MNHEIMYPIQPIMFIKSETNTPYHPGVRLIRVDPYKTPPEQLTTQPPRKRSFVVGIKPNGELNIIFFKDELAGHAECESILRRIIPDTLSFIEGNISPEPTRSTAKDEKKPHSITIHGRSSEDAALIGDIPALKEEGIESPEKFVTPEIAEALMTALQADKLTITHNRSKAIPGYRRTDPHDESDYYHHEGD